MKKLMAAKSSVMFLIACFVIAVFLALKSSSAVLATEIDPQQVCLRECNATCVEECDGNQLCEGLCPGLCEEECSQIGCSPSPSATPTEEPTPTPDPTATPVEEPTPSPLSCSGTQHLDASGRNCVDFAFGGPSGDGGSAAGQVLGATTMPATGSFAENIYLAIMSLGGLFTFKGLKKFFKKA